MIKEQLTRDLNFNKLHNAYLIATEDTKAAMEEVWAFLSENFYARQENHPDFMLVERARNAKNITIDQTRVLQSFLNKTSVLSGIKSTVILGADLMNVNTANSCLKILEDTPKNTYIFLITNNAAMILPTIRSRCAKVVFHSCDEHENPVDDYYIKPLLKSTSIEEHLVYLNEFGNKDRQLWAVFTENVLNLIVRIAKKLALEDVSLSPLESKFLEQIMPISPRGLEQQYEKLVKLIEDTIVLDLDLRASYLVLVNRLLSKQHFC